MLNVTTEAKVFLSGMIAARDLSSDQSLRLVPTDEDLAAFQLQADKERPGDTKFSHDGRALLLVEERVAQELDGKVLDAAEDGTTGEKKLTIA